MNKQSTYRELPIDAINKQNVLIEKHIKLYLKNDNLEITKETVGHNSEDTGTFCITIYNKELDDEEEKYILKICNDNYEDIKNISLECYNIGIAPKVLYYDKTDRIIIYEFINVTLTKGISSIYRLKNLISNIKLYHNIKYTTNITHNFENLKNTKLYDPKLNYPFFIAFEIINKLTPYLIDKYGLVLSHNDIHDSNRLWSTDKFFIIDYEMSYYNTPFIDLGYQTLYFINKEEELLKEYFQIDTVSDELKNDFILGKCLSFLYIGLNIRTNSIVTEAFINTEITHNFKELKTLTTTPYDKLYNINCYNTNENYFISSLFIKEGFFLIKNNIELFKPFISDNLLYDIFTLL
jgi:hypothetical protein